MTLGNRVSFFSLDFVADCVDFPLYCFCCVFYELNLPELRQNSGNTSYYAGHTHAIIF